MQHCSTNLTKRVQHHATSTNVHEKFDHFEPTTPNMSQHPAIRWLNAGNMLRTTMLRSFGRGLKKGVNFFESKLTIMSYFILHKKSFYGFKTTSRYNLVSFEAISSKQCFTANASLSIIYYAKFMFWNVFALLHIKLTYRFGFCIFYLYIGINFDHITFILVLQIFNV